MQKNSIEEQKIQKATNNILRGEDIESAAYILEKFMFNNVNFIGRRVNPVKVATRQVLNFIKRYQESDYETICLENNEMEEIVDKIQVEYNNLLKENEYMHKELDKQQTTINKYAKENEELKEYKRNVEKNYKKENKQLKNTIAIVDKLEEKIKENFVPKEKIETIIKKINVYKKLAKESMEQEIVIADNDSLEYGRMQAHNLDMSMLLEELEL